MNYFQTRSSHRWVNIMLGISVLYIPALAILLVVAPEIGKYAIPGIIIPALYVPYRYKEVSNFIDYIINNKLPLSSKFKFYTITYPNYKFVDVHNAILKLLESYVVEDAIYSTHYESLSDIITSQFFNEANRALKPSAKTPWKVDHAKDVFIANDTFWLVKMSKDPEESDDQFVIRLAYNTEQKTTTVEIGAGNDEKTLELKNKIEEGANQNSIYKNKLITVNFSEEIRDEYGEQEKRSAMTISFLNPEKVTRDDIVLSEKIEKTLQRNLIDFFNNGEVIKNHSISLNRGLLFYGPPGTGKTYTCHYIYHRLKDVSTIVATGQSLVHIQSICNMARILQPSIVILEDVDLVFSSRETNLYSTVLGDLMDQLDGFTNNDQIVFILTTNDIERLEKAIKDRPGRISQCIYFDVPNNELRKRYLDNKLRGIAGPGVDLQRLSAKIEGASQAFISEMIQLACQVNLEKSGYDQNHKIDLCDDDFDEAISAMLDGNNNTIYNILGYKSQVL